ncbi:MAG: hypothetical protein ABIG96_02685 [Candidatus Micrarchaeota archaeon]
MAKEGRYNPGGIGDLHSHMERMNIPDNVRRFVSKNRKEAVNEWENAQKGNEGGFISFLIKAGLATGAAAGFVRYMMSHHKHM